MKSMKQKSRTTVVGAKFACALGLAVAGLMPAKTVCANPFGGQLQIKQAVQVDQDKKQEKEKDRDSGDTNRFPHGGAVATSPEVDRILAKASRYQKESNYRAASRFWLAALERAAGKLYSKDQELYYPLVQHIESELAKLPPEGMKIYRIAADAQAEEILAAGKDADEIETLQKVVDVAFLSSKGDQSALKLASLYLDRFNSAEAEALLRRVVEVYPNPDVPMDQVWLKLAIARYLNGNVADAKVALKKAKELQNEVGDDMIKAVGQMFSQKRTASVSTQSIEGLASPFGIGNKTEIALSLPADYLENDLQPVWMFQHQLRSAKTMVTRGRYIEGEVKVGGKKILSSKTGSTSQGRTLKSVLKKWKRGGWQTVSSPLVIDGKVLFKTQADLAVWSTDLTATKPVLRSKKLNRYSSDAVTQQLFQYSESSIANYPSARNMIYKNPYTMANFGDSLYQSMVVYKGVAYSVEGLPFERDGSPSHSFSSGRRINVWSSPRLRTRETFLQAYDLKTGKTLWDDPFPKSDKKEYKNLKDGAVVGPPVGFQDNLLLPYLNGDEMLLISVSRADGKINWKSSVCFLPELSPESGTAVQISVDERSIYMTAGTGVLASVDANTGNIKWVRKYKRSVLETENDDNMRMMGHMHQPWLGKELGGWEHDLAMSWGPWIVVAGTDTDYLAGFRKSDGKLVWKAPRKNVLGCTVDRWLGYYDGIVYATGKNSLIAYELQAEGRLYGNPTIVEGNITGKGILTKNGIYLPVGNTVQKFDLKSLAKIGEANVDLPEGMMLGSLISDGKRLWCASLHRLFALEKFSKVEKEKNEEK